MAKTNRPAGDQENPESGAFPRMGRDRGEYHGWAGVAHSLLNLKLEYIAPWAVVAALGAVLYFTLFMAPSLVEARDAASMRLLQEEAERNRQNVREEWERNRLFTADRDRQILNEFKQESEKSRASVDSSLKFLFNSIVELAKQMATLKASIDVLNKRMEAKGGEPPEPIPMPGAEVSPIVEDLAQWGRMVAGFAYLMREHNRDDGADR